MDHEFEAWDEFEFDSSFFDDLAAFDSIAGEFLESDQSAAIINNSPSVSLAEEFCESLSGDEGVSQSFCPQLVHSDGRKRTAENIFVFVDRDIDLESSPSKKSQRVGCDVNWEIPTSKKSAMLATTSDRRKSAVDRWKAKRTRRSWEKKPPSAARIAAASRRVRQQDGTFQTAKITWLRGGSDF